MVLGGLRAHQGSSAKKILRHPQEFSKKFSQETILPGTPPRKFLGNSPSSRPKTKEEPKNASSSEAKNNVDAG